MLCKMAPEPQTSRPQSPVVGATSRNRMRKRRGNATKPPTVAGSSKPTSKKRARRARPASPSPLLPPGPRPTIDGRPQLTHESVASNLYHSVMSAAIDVGSFSNGDDSDDGEDAEWRMRFKQVLLHEFVDMMAVEKVSMNLWNQFILGEYRISSDRFVLPAVKEFVVRYGGEIKRMQMEMIFVRHIVVLSNCGVLDADGVDEIWELLREIPPNGEIEGRFKYARRTLKDERGLRQNYSDADWKDAGSADDESGDALDEDPFNHRQLLESLQNNVDAAGLPFFESPDALAQMNLIDAAEQPSSPTPAGPSAQTSAAVPVHVVAGSSEFHKKK